MNSILYKAIDAVQQSELSYSKFITANDTGSTGGHQAGFHIHKNSWSLFFDKPGNKGENKDKFITIKWQGDFETASRIIYYGVGTRNEYRLTRFGRNFPFLSDDNTGSLLVICKQSIYYYEAFVLNKDDEIDEFFASLNISISDVNGLIPNPQVPNIEDNLIHCFTEYVNRLKGEFPSTINLAFNARKCYNLINKTTITQLINNPDEEILGWINAEFQLFKMIENKHYSHLLKNPFESVEKLIETANSILNRRKSRAGKSLEHHLSEIFNSNKLIFDTQEITEDKKKPDFIFPGIKAYRNSRFDENKLIILAAKTTCKDRWRQILNEADRVKTKHLFTLQQGISKNQLEEMYKYGVCLVVPRPFLKDFPKGYSDHILSLNSFIDLVRQSQL